MTKEQFHLFLKLQKNEIEKYKWIESEKRGYDIGNKACLEWIDKYAEQFYKNYKKENNL
jgi:hypothetical protein